MAIDTEQKRAGIIGISAYFLSPSRRPGESYLDEQARAVSGYGYLGIAASSPSPVVPSGGVVTQRAFVKRSEWRRPSGVKYYFEEVAIPV